jgi:hypothetical protein
VHRDRPPVQRAERLRGQHRLERPDPEERAVLVHEGELPGVVRDRLEPVRHHRHREAAAGVQLAEQVHRRELGGGVHAVRGLVQHDELRIAHQRPRDERALALAAGQLADEDPGELGDADAVERALRRLAVGAPRPAERPEHRRPAHEDDLARREGPDRVHVLALRDVADPDRLRPDDAASEERQRPEQRADERRLPGAVRADQREEVAGTDLEIDAREQGAAPVAHRGALEREEGRAHRSAPASLDTRTSTYRSYVFTSGSPPTSPGTRTTFAPECRATTSADFVP